MLFLFKDSLRVCGSLLRSYIRSGNKCCSDEWAFNLRDNGSVSDAIVFEIFSLQRRSLLRNFQLIDAIRKSQIHLRDWISIKRLLLLKLKLNRQKWMQSEPSKLPKWFEKLEATLNAPKWTQSWAKYYLH